MKKLIYMSLILSLVSLFILSSISNSQINSFPSSTDESNWHVYRPDLSKTPGDVDPNATIKNLCTPGYTGTIRIQTEKIKKTIFSNYGINWRDHSMYEDDHLISLVLGGTNEIKNRWPQYYCPLETAGKTCFGAREKDVVENFFHKYVCNKDITETEAKNRLKFVQEQIVKDWFAVYRKIKGL